MKKRNRWVLSGVGMLIGGLGGCVGPGAQGVAGDGLADSAEWRLERDVRVLAEGFGERSTRTRPLAEPSDQALTEAVAERGRHQQPDDGSARDQERRAESEGLFDRVIGGASVNDYETVRLRKDGHAILLISHNFEQVLPAAGWLVDLLSACPIEGSDARVVGYGANTQTPSPPGPACGLTDGRYLNAPRRVD